MTPLRPVAYVFDLAMRFLYYYMFAFFGRIGLWVTNV
jgi:hypothetical protein